MKRVLTAVAMLALAGCHQVPSSSPAAKAFGAAIVGISGEKQSAGVGAMLDQPIVVQVNDAQGSAVAGALVDFRAASGVRFNPPSGLTGSDGQLSATVRLSGMSGAYSLAATTRDKAGKPLQVTFAETALDYQQTLGWELSEKYCSRCHNSESTAEKVSNHDNLRVPPHSLSDGATSNQISPANLVAIIGHGGAALGKSAEMPPYSPTLSASDIDALAAYIRAVADPPYRPQGVFNANP
jgi:mono/diheme cytochrome c family protein